MYLSREPAGPSAHLVPYLVSRTAGTLNRAWLEHLREQGMTIARWQVLAILGEYDGARLGELARLAGAEQSVTSRVVDQMERDRLVRRRTAAGDGRAVEVLLTRSGRALFHRLLPAAEGLVTSALRGIDEATAQTLMGALTTIMANIEEPGALPYRARAGSLAHAE